MRHRKHKYQKGNTSSRRALIANALKSLIKHGKIYTTKKQGKMLKKHADKIITKAKKIPQNEQHWKRQIKADLMLNTERQLILSSLEALSKRYEKRHGGYTRIESLQNRRGDNAQMCVLEYVKADVSASTE